MIDSSTLSNLKYPFSGNQGQLQDFQHVSENPEHLHWNVRHTANWKGSETFAWIMYHHCPLKGDPKRGIRSTNPVTFTFKSLLSHSNCFSFRIPLWGTVVGCYLLRSFFILRTFRPRSFECKFCKCCTKKLDGALRTTTLYV